MAALMKKERKLVGKMVLVPFVVFLNTTFSNLKRNKIPFLRRKLGIIFQDFQLLMDRSVLENLNFVLRATGWKDKIQMKERTDKVLDMVGLKTKNFKMPHELSGGEQQRLVIARALLNEPELILADEPTGNLDPALSREVMDLFHQFNQVGVCVLIATHDLDLVRETGRRELVLRQGSLISGGDP